MDMDNGCGWVCTCMYISSKTPGYGEEEITSVCSQFGLRTIMPEVCNCSLVTASFCLPCV